MIPNKIIWTWRFFPPFWDEYGDIFMTSSFEPVNANFDATTRENLFVAMTGKKNKNELNIFWKCLAKPNLEKCFIRNSRMYKGQKSLLTLIIIVRILVHYSMRLYQWLLKNIIIELNTVCCPRQHYRENGSLKLIRTGKFLKQNNK